MPAYLRFEGLDQKIIVNYLKRLTEELKERGHIYSNEEAQKNVGYDYGLLLCNLVRYRLPGAQAVYDKLLDLLDEAGAWSEYYVADQPARHALPALGKRDQHRRSDRICYGRLFVIGEREPQRSLPGLCSAQRPADFIKIHITKKLKFWNFIGI